MMLGFFLAHFFFLLSRFVSVLFASFFSAFLLTRFFFCLPDGHLMASFFSSATLAVVSFASFHADFVSWVFFLSMVSVIWLFLYLQWCLS